MYEMLFRAPVISFTEESLSDTKMGIRIMPKKINLQTTLSRGYLLDNCLLSYQFGCRSIMLLGPYLGTQVPKKVSTYTSLEGFKALWLLLSSYLGILIFSYRFPHVFQQDGA